VLGEITVASYNLQFIPLEEDVISMECEGAFKEIWVVSVACVAVCDFGNCGLTMYVMGICARGWV